MFECIVVGVDGSETASEALRKAVGLARQAGARVRVVTAYKDATSAAAAADPHAGPVLFSPQADAAIARHAESVAQRAAQEAEGLDVKALAIAGDPADVILDLAEEEGADLIVVGNKGMRGPKRFLLGSVPNRIAHHAGCDVLIVHTT